MIIPGLFLKTSWEPISLTNLDFTAMGHNIRLRDKGARPRLGARIPMPAIVLSQGETRLVREI